MSRKANATMSLPSSAFSRRRFLAGSFAAGVGVLASRWVAAAEPKTDPDLFVLMADTHLLRRAEDAHRKVKPAEAFQQAIDEILALPKRPAGLVIAGDCAHEDAGGYASLRKLTKPLQQAGVSIHFTMGNHDRRDKLLAAFPKMKFLPIDGDKTPGKLVSIWETPRANWFLLDSTLPPKIQTGEFGEAQLAWLAKALDARADKPAIIVAHHHPDPFRKFNGLTDTGAFLKVVLPRKQVKAYFYGHSHVWGLTQMSGMHFVNLPAMAWAFDSTQPRGYVAMQLRPDGATLVLHTLDHKDARCGQKIDLPFL
jgi:3',5'-cyclic-AMP phosphodiesterase